MMEASGDLFSEDLVLCDSDDVRALAWKHLPEKARTRWQLSEACPTE